MGKPLSIDLYDIEGYLIFPKGTNVTKSLLKTLSEKNSKANLPTITLKDSFMYKDFLNITREKNYRPLLRDEELKKKVVTAVEDIELPEVIYKEFSEMKKKSVLLYHHSLATTLITTRIALDFVFFRKLISQIASANLTKDIGMTRLNKSVLMNTDFLSREEYELIKEHTLWGLILLVYYLGEGLNALIAYRHHDRGIHAEEKFKFLDLIIAVDIFNALISPRPFRKKPFNIRGALDLLTDMAAKGEVNEEMVKRIVANYREEYQPPEEVNLSREKLGFIPDDNFYGVKDL